MLKSCVSLSSKLLKWINFLTYLLMMENEKKYLHTIWTDKECN